jgi:hypothetical protein
VAGCDGQEFGGESQERGEAEGGAEGECPKSGPEEGGLVTEGQLREDLQVGGDCFRDRLGGQLQSISLFTINEGRLHKPPVPLLAAVTASAGMPLVKRRAWKHYNWMSVYILSEDFVQSVEEHLDRISILSKGVVGNSLAVCHCQLFLSGQTVVHENASVS